MKKISSLLLIIIFLFFTPIKISHATMIPTGSVSIPAKSIHVVNASIILFSMTTSEDNPITAVITSFEVDHKYDDLVYVEIDGQRIWSSNNSYTPSCALTGLNGTHVKIGAYAPGVSDIKINGGTVQTAMAIADEEARDAANAAKNAADAAKNSADVAKTEATAAKNNAFTASSRVWDSAEGKSAATLSKEARDKANTAASNTTYIRNTQL